MRRIQGVHRSRESHDIGKLLICTALFEYRRIAVDLPRLFVFLQRSSINQLARFPITNSKHAPKKTAGGLAHPVPHLRPAAIVPTALTSNLGGLRLERGLGVTVIRTS